MKQKSKQPSHHLTCQMETRKVKDMVCAHPAKKHVPGAWFKQQLWRTKQTGVCSQKCYAPARVKMLPWTDHFWEHKTSVQDVSRSLLNDNSTFVVPPHISCYLSLSLQESVGSAATSLESSIKWGDSFLIMYSITDRSRFESVSHLKRIIDLVKQTLGKLTIF